MKTTWLCGIALALAAGFAAAEDEHACGAVGAQAGRPGVAGEDGQAMDPAKPVVLRITSPKSGETVDGPDVEVKFELENYKIAKGPQGGNHIHFIVDNAPYAPHYDASKPFVAAKLSEGTHVIRAFPSRPWHEAWKNPEAFQIVVFHVKKASGKAPIDPSKPFVTFSRPKGKYEGPVASKIILDFWVSNCTLSENGYRVKVALDGKEKVLTGWTPVCWDGLAAGKHTVSLTLLGPDGKPVENGWNPTEREIEVAP